MLVWITEAWANRYNNCNQDADIERRIQGCSQVIERGKRENSNNRVLAYYHRGLAHAENGDHDAAITDFTSAIKLKPKYVVTFMSRGISFAAKGDYDSAVADFTRAINRNPKFASAFVERADIYRRKGELDRANKDFVKATKLDPRLAVAYHSRGNKWSRKRRYDRAIAEYDKAIKLSPNYMDAYNSRGRAYYHKRQYDIAIENHNKAIELNPKDAGTYASRGDAYSGKRQYDRAISDYSKTIDLNPRYVYAYRRRGITLRNEGDFDRAIADFGQAIQLYPKDASAYRNRGLAYHNKGLYDRAIADYDKSIEFYSKHADTYINRGNTYQKMGQYDSAIADYNKAIKLNPKNVLAYTNRGWAHLSNKSPGQAESDFRKALELEPKNTAAQDGLKELKSAAAKPQSSPKATRSSRPHTDVEKKMELSFWNSVRSSKDTGMLKLYLDKYPSGTFSELAKALIKSNRDQDLDSRETDTARERAEGVQHRAAGPATKRSRNFNNDSNQGSTPRDRKSFIVMPIVGVPSNLGKRLSQRTTDYIQQKGMAVISKRNGRKAYNLHGYFVVKADTESTEINFIWMVYDEGGAEVHRFTGEVSGTGSTPQSTLIQLNQTEIDKVAAITSQELARWTPSE